MRDFLLGVGLVAQQQLLACGVFLPHQGAFQIDVQQPIQPRFGVGQPRLLAGQPLRRYRALVLFPGVDDAIDHRRALVRQRHGTGIGPKFIRENLLADELQIARPHLSCAAVVGVALLALRRDRPAAYPANEKPEKREAIAPLLALGAAAPLVDALHLLEKAVGDNRRVRTLVDFPLIFEHPHIKRIGQQRGHAIRADIFAV
ncbi:MAG: hypothetical protein BWX68_03047 [Verrucomicrobia bacterium ADurb.Bin063]|nr:MAG: hypothetical protein BWX68_03047 [Verrucomicrobia bacterium ADurb.Bin063]